MNSATDLAALRIKLAKADLRRAKGECCHLIGQTTEGLVEVTHAAGVYTLTKQGMDARVLASGAPKVVAPVLGALYRIA